MSVRRLGYEDADYFDLSARAEGLDASPSPANLIAVPEATPRARKEVVFLVAFLSLVAMFIAFI